MPFIEQRQEEKHLQMQPLYLCIKHQFGTEERNQNTCHHVYDEDNIRPTSYNDT